MFCDEYEHITCQEIWVFVEYFMTSLLKSNKFVNKSRFSDKFVKNNNLSKIKNLWLQKIFK